MSAWPEGTRRLVITLDGVELAAVDITGYELNRMRLSGHYGEHVLRFCAGVAEAFPDEPPPGYREIPQQQNPSLN